ncbi:MAG: AI-2E family transporter [Deltaproteobacteria bacterium]|nr:AI-2E family transporter [Deltaproteobacteria bacterium]
MSKELDPAPRSPALRVDITPRTIAYVLLTIAAVWVVFKLTSVLLVVIVALILVGTIEPLAGWLQHRGLGRGLALALVFVVSAIVFAGLMLLTVPPLVAQLILFITEAPASRDKLLVWLSQHAGTAAIVNSVKSVPVEELTARAGSALLGYSTVIMAAIGYAITTMFLAIYLLADPVRSKGFIYAIVARRHHVKLARILIELKVIVGGYMRGQLITSGAITVFVFVLLKIFGVENALAIAIFAGLTDVIPFVGGMIASAPVIAAVAASGGAVPAIAVALIMLVYQEFESRLLVPRVYGRVLRLAPSVVLIALLIGGTLMGILGALLALPIAAGLQMLLRELRVELPGEEAADASTLARDEKVEHIYEELTEGATAEEAGVIAGSLADQIKRTEQDADRAAEVVAHAAAVPKRDGDGDDR